MIIYFNESGLDEHFCLPDEMPSEEIVETLIDWSKTLIELRFLVSQK